MKFKYVGLYLALMGATAFAGTISTTGAANGTPFSANDITGATTTGAEMGGMQITGTFTSGVSILCTWVNGAGNAGSCAAAGSGAGFSLSLNGDTFTAPWNLTVGGGLNLLSLLFNGPPGFTTFDRTFGGASGTSGSADGGDANGTTSPANVNGTATYQNILSTLGNPAVGDEYAQVLMQFSGGGLAPGSTASFTMDTDSIGLRGGTPGSGVPEPSTWMMFGLGLTAAGCARRWRS
jgi:PEP-CTERM motif